MSLLVIKGTAIGADKLIITEGDGTTSPQLISAVAQNFYTVRLTFDTPMLYFSNYYGGVLDPSNYSLTLGTDSLGIIRIDYVSDTEFDVTTEGLTNQSYFIEVNNVFDHYGALIDGANNSDSIIGIGPDINIKSELYLFSGTEAGLDGERPPGSLNVDSDPPDIVDQSPAPGAKVLPSTNLIDFSVVDMSEVISSTIDAYVNEAIAFTSQSFVAPFDGPDAYFVTDSYGGQDGYRIRLDYTNMPWSSYELIEVRVRAKDVFNNLRDSSYSFRSSDLRTVEFANMIPIPGSINVDKDTLIQVDIYDRGSGVDSTTIDAYVDGHHIFIGNTSTFVSPYDGPLSAIEPTVVDGYDGYRLTIDNTGFFKSYSSVSFTVDGNDIEGN